MLSVLLLTAGIFSSCVMWGNFWPRVGTNHASHGPLAPGPGQPLPAPALPAMCRAWVGVQPDVCPGQAAVSRVDIAGSGGHVSQP